VLQRHALLKGENGNGSSQTCPGSDPDTSVPLLSSASLFIVCSQWRFNVTVRSSVKESEERWERCYIDGRFDFSRR
jgi:hypothetical protein